MIKCYLFSQCAFDYWKEESCRNQINHLLYLLSIPSRELLIWIVQLTCTVQINTCTWHLPAETGRTRGENGIMQTIAKILFGGTIFEYLTSRARKARFKHSIPLPRDQAPIVHMARVENSIVIITMRALDQHVPDLSLIIQIMLLLLRTSTFSALVGWQFIWLV